MRNAIIVATLLLGAALVVYARKRRQENSLQPEAVTPTGGAEPPVDPGVKKKLKKKVSPPDWLWITTLPLLDLETVLGWFQRNKSRLEGVPPTVVGIVLRVNKERPSETWQLGKDFLPEMELLHGDVLVGFYDRETKKMQKQFTVALYKAASISPDLDEQFGKKDLLIIE
jgi:hypothetical protein